MGLFSFISKKKKKKNEDIPFAYADQAKQSEQEPIDEGLKDESEMKPKTKSAPKKSVKVSKPETAAAENTDIVTESQKPEKKSAPKKSAKESKPEAAAGSKPKATVAESKDVATEPKKREKKPVKASTSPLPQAEELDTKIDDTPVAEEGFEGETVTETGFVDEAPSNGKPARTGTFEIKRAKDGRYVFNLYASNRVIIARSQIYSSSSRAITGIKSVITNAPRANIEDTTLKSPVRVSFPKWEIYLDKAGQYRFRLYATNGDCICHSRGYTAKSSCKSGIQSIIRFATDAKINKIYLDNKG